MSCGLIVLIAQTGGPEEIPPAVGGGATMQDALGGGKPEDVEARKQEAEQAVQNSPEFKAFQAEREANAAEAQPAPAPEAAPEATESGDGGAWDVGAPADTGTGGD